MPPSVHLRAVANLPSPPPVRRVAVWIPCRDQAVSERFYTALCGPPVERSGGFVMYRWAETALWLQDFYVREWAENTVLYLGVEDADAWHAHLLAVRERQAPDLRIGAPRDEPWGHRVVTTWDPSGVLLHLAAPIER